LTTDGNPGNRRPTLSFLVGAVPVSVSVQPRVLGPSTSGDFYWVAGLPLTTDFGATVGVAGLPNGPILLAGYRFQIGAINDQAGDNWSAPTYTVREWLEAQ
jgi:hypothetical protein